MTRGIEFLFLTVLKRGENTMPIHVLTSFFKDVLRKITMHCVLQAQSGDYVWFFLSRDTPNKAEVCEGDLFVQQLCSKCNLWFFVRHQTYVWLKFPTSTLRVLPPLLFLERFCLRIARLFSLMHKRIQYTLLFRRINHINNDRLIGNSEHFNCFGNSSL